MATSAQSSLQAQLAAAGYSFPFNIAPFIQAAVRAGQGADYAYALILRSPQFKQAYPGIFRANGTLKMTPAQYEAYVDAARAAASTGGFRITRGQIGQLIGSNTSADEFAFRVQAARQIRSNSTLLKAFSNELTRSKLPRISTAQQAFDFFTGRSTASVYALYEAAAFQTAAVEAGLEAPGGLGRQLAAKTAEVFTYDEARKRFQELAKARALAGPELKDFGLSVADQAMVAAGVASRDVLGRYEQAVRQREAGLQTTLAEPRQRLTPEGRPIAGTLPEPGA